MAKLCIIVMSTLVSWLAWYAAEWCGFEFFGCFVISSLGALLGCWPGWLIYRRFFS